MATEATLPVGQNNPEVICAKCGYSNPDGTEACIHCGRHVYVWCHCGARNLRSRRNCKQCGDVLRSRREQGGNSIFGTSRELAFGPSCASRSPNDLGAALLMFALVGLLFGAVLLYPVFQAREAELQDRREEAYQACRSQQANSEAMQLELQRRILEQQRRNER